MKWTSEVPTEAGWYWLDEYMKPSRIVRVRESVYVGGRSVTTGGPLVVRGGFGVTHPVYKGWAGPIPEPSNE